MSGLVERAALSQQQAGGGFMDDGDEDEQVGIWKAAAEGDLEEMKALMLAENLDANSRSPVGDTALHLAAQHGRLDVVKWLIENGADVMAKDMELNGSPIIFAAIGGHPEVVRALVEGGANVDEAYTSPDNSVTPLMFSTQYAGLMKVKGDAWEKHTEVVRTLCDLKADVNLRDANKRTALMFACELGHLELVQMCLEHGANLSDADVNLTNSVMFAAKGGNLDVVKLLVEKGADPKKTNIKQTSAMHTAAHGGHKAVCIFLKEQGVPTDAPNAESDTPLSMAIQSQKLPVVGWLVERAGVDINWKNSSGKTYLDMAGMVLCAHQSQGSVLVYDYIKRKGAKLSTLPAKDVNAAKMRAETRAVAMAALRNKQLIDKRKSDLKAAKLQQQMMQQT